MIRPPPKTTSTDTHVPSTTLRRSREHAAEAGLLASRQLVLRMRHQARIEHTLDRRLFTEPFGQTMRVLAMRLHAHRKRFRSEEQTSELQSLMRTSYAVFCFQQQNRPHEDKG